MSGRALIPAACLAVLLSAATGLAAGPEGAAMTMSASQRAEVDQAVHLRFQKCWVMTEATYSTSVTVRFQLNRDGSLLGDPAVVEIKPTDAPAAAVQAATTAIRKCTPIALPLQFHGYWRDVQIKFQAPNRGRLFGASDWPQ